MSEKDEKTADLESDEPTEVKGKAKGKAKAKRKPSRARSGSSSSRPVTKYDPLDAFLAEIQNYPLLQPDEERALAEHYVATGDVHAAARLVTSNLRLVVKIAFEYRRAYRNIMDLIQEGIIGLMHAVKKYDPTRGVKLSSYAAWWIRAYILRFILNNWRLVKLGTTQAQRKLFFNLNKERSRLQAMGIEPTNAVLAERIGVTEKDVIEMDRRLQADDVSLDADVYDADGRPLTRMEMLADSRALPDKQISEAYFEDALRERLNEFAAPLTDKEEFIFHNRLTRESPMTLQEIGDVFGVSRERVRQLEKRLLSKLRKYLETELPEYFAEDGAE